MNRIPDRSRPLVILATGLLVVLLVAGGVLLVGQLAPTPTPSPTAPPSTPVQRSVEASTPESATRAFFDALVSARRTDDPSLIEPFVTSRESSAYLTVAGFLAGQKESGKASITTALELSDTSVQQTGDSAQLIATLREEGYDISLDTGEPRESPVALPLRKLTVALQRTGDAWRVESFETSPTP